MGGYDKRARGIESGMGAPGIGAIGGGPGKQTLTGQLAPIGAWPAMTGPMMTGPMMTGPAMVSGGRGVEGETPTTRSDDEFYAQVSAIIQGQLDLYQAIPVHVAEPAGPGDTSVAAFDITVATPYFNQRYVEYMHKETNPNASRPTEEYRTANAQPNRMHLDFFPEEKVAVAAAKGSPEMITAEVQRAVDAHEMTASPPNAEAWKVAVETWMRRAGVGVDCAGLVYDALLAVKTQMPDVKTTANLPVPISNNALTEAESRTGMSTEMLGGAPYGEDPAQPLVLGQDVDPLDIRPGDVMYRTGHVRIVIRRDTSDDPSVVMFTTAESSIDPLASKDATPEGWSIDPYGLAGVGGAPPPNGPRMHHWKWDGTTLWMRFEDESEGTWRDSGETPNLQRHIIAPSEAAATPPAT